MRLVLENEPETDGPQILVVKMCMSCSRILNGEEYEYQAIDVTTLVQLATQRLPRLNEVSFQHRPCPECSSLCELTDLKNATEDECDDV
ncbi:MAG: hypothetical protein HN402_07760 [Candidatus Scalindua sp.]|jgi:hypothetical protein|nr:hypothetical protein [Candidatus Scalindua sp.]